MTTLLNIKFGSDRMKTGGVAFWNFHSETPFETSIVSHVNENEKKNRKNLKNWKFKKKKCLEVQLRGTYQQNLSWIYSTVSERPDFTDDGRTTDGRTTDASATTVKTTHYNILPDCLSTCARQIIYPTDSTFLKYILHSK